MILHFVRYSLLLGVLFQFNLFFKCNMFSSPLCFRKTDEIIQKNANKRCASSPPPSKCNTIWENDAHVITHISHSSPKSCKINIFTFLFRWHSMTFDIHLLTIWIVCSSRFVVVAFSLLKKFTYWNWQVFFCRT